MTPPPERLTLIGSGEPAPTRLLRPVPVSCPDRCPEGSVSLKVRFRESPCELARLRCCCLPTAWDVAHIREPFRASQCKNPRFADERETFSFVRICSTGNPRKGVERPADYDVAMLTSHQSACTASTSSAPDFVDITPSVVGALEESGIRDGQVTIFCPDDGCSILVNEFEAGLLADLKRTIKGSESFWPRAAIGLRSVVVPASEGRLLYPL